jgi:MSHA pilin protein MshC
LHVDVQVGWFRPRLGGNQRGFTLVELVMTMVIIGILAAVVAPRFFDANVFKSRGFADQVQSTLRYAQKEAIAQRRNVCVALNATTITLKIATTSGTGNACTNILLLPGGSSNSISAPTGSGITMTYSLPSFVFYGSGAPSFTSPGYPTVNVSISGATNSITIEAQTGYVHSP